MLGLYQIGDVSAIPLLYEMAKHPEIRFRNTCAWVMGRTGDPRFLPVLAAMMTDPQAGRYAESPAQASSPEPESPGAVRGGFQSRNRWGVVKVGSELAPSGMQSAETGEHRSKWSALELSSLNPLGSLNGLGHFDPRFEHASHPQAFVAMAEQPPLEFSQAEALVDQLLTVEIGSKPHIIFVGAPIPPSILANLASHPGAPAVLHMVSVSTPEARDSAKAQTGQYAISTGWTYLEVPPNELTDRCRVLFGSLLHNYRISSPEIDDPIEVQINAAAGHATATNADNAS